MARDFLQHQPRVLLDITLIFVALAVAMLPWCAAIGLGLLIGGACS